MLIKLEPRLITKDYSTVYSDQWSISIPAGASQRCLEERPKGESGRKEECEGRGGGEQERRTKSRNITRVVVRKYEEEKGERREVEKKQKLARCVS